MRAHRPWRVRAGTQRRELGVGLDAGEAPRVVAGAGVVLPDALPQGRTQRCLRTSSAMLTLDSIDTCQHEVEAPHRHHYDVA